MRKILFSLLIIATIAGCDREIPAPVSNPISPEIPVKPTSLSVCVGDRELQLDWHYGDTTDIAWYHIYNADSLYGAYELIDSTQTRTFLITGLRNAEYYFYKVSAVNTNGAESNLSDAAYGRPNLYNMIIENGLEQTATRLVTLTMVAPNGASLMKIANDSLFTDAAWEAYTASKSWLLTESAGDKTVYVLFRDSDGNDTYTAITDDIEYNIAVFHYSITVNNDAAQTYSRDVSLRISAPDGTTWMMISNSNDFSEADWEEYATSREWYIPIDVAANRDTVGFYATFRDANSDSVEIIAQDLIVLANADSVTLYSVYQPEDSYQEVDLTWSRSLSGDFEFYRVFRSRGAASADTLVSTIYNIEETSYSDGIAIDELLDDTPVTVSYMIRFYSLYDDSSDSNPINVSLVNNQPPTIASFIRDINYDIDTLSGIDMDATFGWQRSDIIDFESYVIYENTVLNSGSANPVYYSYDQSTLSYSLSKNNVDTTQVYYYWLKIVDLGGRESAFSQPDSVYY